MPWLNDKQFLDILDEEHGYTNLEIGQILQYQITESTVRKRLGELESKGFVKHTINENGAWIWFKVKSNE